MKRARQSGFPIVYVNQVGGQDELVFDGGSFAVCRLMASGCGAPILRRASTGCRSVFGSRRCGDFRAVGRAATG